MEKLHHKEIDLELDRFSLLLEKLGNPQDNMPATIHVAGTNAKGSTIAILQACFDAASYRVGCFTSPYLVRPHECINYSGEDISEEDLSSLLKEVIKANNNEPMTVFEALSAVMFLYFSRSKAHIVLMETGMGGLKDTTNVIKTPVMTIITPIALDHQEFLGKKIAKIAAQKAGIIKPNVPCVVSNQEDEAYEVIRDKANDTGIKMYREGREWFVKRAGDKMIFEGWLGDNAWPRPSLKGDHQINNAGIALACLEALKPAYNLPEEAIRNGLQTIDWPGRMQKVNLSEILPKRFEVWIDGGHNEHAAKALKALIKTWDDKPTYLISGLLKSKNSKTYFAQMAGRVDHVYTVPLKEKKSKKPEKLAEQVQEAGGLATACEDLNLALELIKAERKEPARILICGSLHLVAEVLSMLEDT